MISIFCSYLVHFLSLISRNKKTLSPKKLSYSSNFSYFRNWNPVLLSPQSKNKKKQSWENLLCFRKRKPPKKLLYFFEKCCCYFSGNGKPEKTLYFRKLLIFKEITLRAEKMKKPTLKILLIFQLQA